MLAPSADTVTCSSPRCVPCSFIRTCPWLSLMVLTEASGLPFLTLALTGSPLIGRPAESARVATRSADSPRFRWLGPDIDRRVPTTLTTAEAVWAPTVAVTLIARFRREPPVPSTALALPLLSVLAPATARKPESAENEIGASATAVLSRLLTSAVSLTSSSGRPAEPSSLLLTTRLIATALAAGSGAGGADGDGAGWALPPQPPGLVREHVFGPAALPPPQPASTSPASKIQALQ